MSSSESQNIELTKPNILLSIRPEEIQKPDIVNINTIPQCKKNLKYMFRITCIPAIRNKYKPIRIIVPIISNCFLIAGSFCMVYYPDYYPTQGEIWTADLVLITIVYNYMLYLQYNWSSKNNHENVEVSNSTNRITLLFYWLYLIYWFYFAVIQFNTHSHPNSQIQIQNIIMSIAWFYFFSTAATLYYFICIKLAQRATSIDVWMKKIKKNHIPLSDFYLQYNWHYKQIKMFGQNWNSLIFAGFLLLMFHVPIDLISIVYKHYYYDIPGLIIKLFSLLWYTWNICALNECETSLISRLYKHRVYDVQQIQDFQKYAQCRPIGLNFYGIKINTGFVTKILIIVLNLIIPTLYALLKNNIFK